METNHKIYILLSHSGSIFSKLINIFSKAIYTHVSIALDKELNELYSFGRINPYNPIIGGFVKEDIVNGTYGRFPKTTCALYSLEIDEEQYKKLKSELEKFKKEKDKYGYNLLGVMSAAFNFPLRRKYKYFCSQFVSEVLLNSGIKLIDKNPSLTAPIDFRSCEELEMIYEGYLKKYYYEYSNRVSTNF
jgi:hypothetical protein